MRGKAATAGALVLAAPVLLVLGLGLVAAGGGALSPAPQPAKAASCTGTSATAGKTVAGSALGPAQISNARVIYNVAASMGLPQRAAVIGIATAMQESRLENVSYGTSDSLGLFQQRPSQGWGSPAEIMQPVYAATAFYQHLVSVPGWQSLPVTVAAQAVQKSAYPSAYAQWQPLASALAAAFSGSSPACTAASGTGVPESGITRLPEGFTLPAGTPAPVVAAIGYAVAQLGKPYVFGATGPAAYDCSGLVMMAYLAGGIVLPRTTYQQVKAGTPVYSLRQLKPGDLLFTPGSDGTPDNPGHVGIYMGSHLVIQA
ncbi:MAG: C40 family peptidase, partial [Nocardiopsaceae bacterium]|nr:C40 family peptidase [Nocardiopsaceae bacterium]